MNNYDELADLMQKEIDSDQLHHNRGETTVRGLKKGQRDNKRIRKQKQL